MGKRVSFPYEEIIQNMSRLAMFVSRYGPSTMDKETIGVVARLCRQATNGLRPISRRGKLDDYRDVLCDASDRLTRFLEACPDTGLDATELVTMIALKAATVNSPGRITRKRVLEEIEALQIPVLYLPKICHDLSQREREAALGAQGASSRRYKIGPDGEMMTAEQIMDRLTSASSQPALGGDETVYEVGAATGPRLYEVNVKGDRLSAEGVLDLLNASKRQYSVTRPLSLTVAAEQGSGGLVDGRLRVPIAAEEVGSSGLFEHPGSTSCPSSRRVS